MARRRSEEEIDQVLEQYRASGLMQIEYCRQTGMVLSTLGRYLRRPNRPEQRLVQVELESAGQAATGFCAGARQRTAHRERWGFGDAKLARLPVRSHNHLVVQVMFDSDSDLDKPLRLKAGESILILGASGGIGHLAVQLAKRMKARVLAGASGQGGFRRPERCVRRRKAWQLPRPLKQRRTSGGTIRCTDWYPGPN